MTALTVRLDDGSAQRLAELAEKLNRSEAELARQAVDDFLSAQEWQIADIEAGLAEADRGEFVPDEAIAEMVRKYTVSEPKA
jgi:predicted transcriptional regulator